MGNAKFQVTIKNIDENALGPILGSLPNNVAPEIMRMHGRTTSKLAPKIEKIAPSEPLKPANTLQEWLNQLPPKFRARDFMNVLDKNGANPSSVTHFIRRAVQAKMLRKVAGTGGNQTQYEQL